MKVNNSEDKYKSEELTFWEKMFIASKSGELSAYEEEQLEIAMNKDHGLASRCTDIQRMWNLLLGGFKYVGEKLALSPSQRQKILNPSNEISIWNKINGPWLYIGLAACLTMGIFVLPRVVKDAAPQMGAAFESDDYDSYAINLSDDLSGDESDKWGVMPQQPDTSSQPKSAPKYKTETTFRSTLENDFTTPTAPTPLPVAISKPTNSSKKKPIVVSNSTRSNVNRMSVISEDEVKVNFDSDTSVLAAIQPKDSLENAYAFRPSQETAVPTSGGLDANSVTWDSRGQSASGPIGGGGKAIPNDGREYAKETSRLKSNWARGGRAGGQHGNALGLALPEEESIELAQDSNGNNNSTAWYGDVPTESVEEFAAKGPALYDDQTSTIDKFYESSNPSGRSESIAANSSGVAGKAMLFGSGRQLEDMDAGMLATGSISLADEDYVQSGQSFSGVMPNQLKSELSELSDIEELDVARESVVIRREMAMIEDRKNISAYGGFEIANGSVAEGTNIQADDNLRMIELRTESGLESLNKELDHRNKISEIQRYKGLKEKELDETKVLSRKAAKPETEKKLRKASELDPFPETEVKDTPLSTFSLNVSDAAFRIAQAAFNNGSFPDQNTIRSEEFINAFDYKDPIPPMNKKVDVSTERALWPFEINREVIRIGVRANQSGLDLSSGMNLVILLDTSGSMEREDRVRVTEQVLEIVAKNLSSSDTISLIGFSSQAQLWVDSMPGGKPDEFVSIARGIRPTGGTNIEQALKLGYEKLFQQFKQGGNNRLLLLTDGAANLGEVEGGALSAVIEANRKKGAVLDCFGIGWDGYDDTLLEELTRNGDGKYGFLNSVSDADQYFASNWLKAVEVSAKNVKVQVEFNPERVVRYRQMGYQKHRLTAQQFRDNSVDAGEIGKAESGNALYVVEINNEGSGPIGWIRVRYQDPVNHQFSEDEKILDFRGEAPSLEVASPSLKLAASAGAFAEWLGGNPYSAQVELPKLETMLEDVVGVYQTDPRPMQLNNMIRSARMLGGSRRN